jgi:Lhr-like helicase
VIPESSVLIFCPTKKGTETVALQLASAFPREITDVKVHLIGVHAKKKKKNTRSSSGTSCVISRTAG